MNCSEIVTRQGLAPGTVSHHLRILEEAGLIECRRDGQFILTRLFRGLLKSTRIPSGASPHRVERGGDENAELRCTGNGSALGGVEISFGFPLTSGRYLPRIKNCSER